MSQPLKDFNQFSPCLCRTLSCDQSSLVADKSFIIKRILRSEHVLPHKDNLPSIWILKLCVLNWPMQNTNTAVFEPTTWINVLAGLYTKTHVIFPNLPSVIFVFQVQKSYPKCHSVSSTKWNWYFLACYHAAIKFVNAKIFKHTWIRLFLRTNRWN